MVRRGLALLLLALAAACGVPSEDTRTLVVTATAYTSDPRQTAGDPFVGAWGDRLEPGTRSIAVSPDLEALGLGRGARVRIEGLRGEYVVLDRMPARWSRRIDVYMGTDRRAALRFGRREVRIHWEPGDS